MLSSGDHAVRNPESPSPFVRHVTATPEDSLAAFGSESDTALFPSEPPAVRTREAPPAAKLAVRSAASAPRHVAEPLRRRMAWVRQPSTSIAPIWLVVVAVGSAAAGIGYARYFRQATVVPQQPTVVSQDTAPTAAATPLEPRLSAPPAVTTTSNDVGPSSTPRQTRARLPAESVPRPTRPQLPSAPPARAIDSDVLSPSAIAALPHVPAAQPLAPAPPPAPEPAEEPESVRDQRLIRSLLEAYRLAYERRDPLAVAALWPGVDSRAVTRAFSTLNAQRMTFDRCEVSITGVVAVARCDGRLDYSRSVGETDTQSRQMAWAFALERGSGQWRISGVNSR
jgi:hypothetical protein